MGGKSILEHQSYYCGFSKEFFNDYLDGNRGFVDKFGTCFRNAINDLKSS